MSRPQGARTKRRPDRLRAGLTLTEVLFAAGILAIGVLGVMSLVPSAMHQVTMSSNRTIGAAVAKNALLALQQGQLDLLDYNGPAGAIDPNEPIIDTGLYASSYRDETVGGTRIELSSGSVPLINYGGWPEAIYARHVDATLGPVGDGAQYPTYQIPGDTDFLAPSTWAGIEIGSARPPFIPCAWSPGYGWTATFMPISVDDDGDGSVDEDSAIQSWANVNDDPGTDNLVDEDDLIMPNTSYRVQIAVWRNPGWRQPTEHPLLLYPRASGSPSGTWTNGNIQVNVNGSLVLADVGDYIRLDSYGIWYRIAAIDQTNPTNPVVTLTSPFVHRGGTLTGPISVANNFKLVVLHEGVVKPREPGDVP